MKKNRLFLFVLICSIFVFSMNVCAEKQILLYEKYGYDENYTYEGEMAAHVLKVTTAYVETQAKITVTYNTLEFDKSEIEEFIEKTKEEKEDFSKNELNEYVSDYVISNYEDFSSETTEKTSDILGGRGSGVVISEDGYIATNSHVINILNSYDEQDKAKELLENTLIENGTKDVEKDLKDAGLKLSSSNKSDLKKIINELATNDYKIKTEYAHCVAFPAADGNTSAKKASVYDAELIKDGTPVSQSETGLTEDAAILKVNKKNMVALKLSEKYPEVNSSIITAGFPGAADDIFLEAGSDESVLSVSVGSGNIARIVPIEGTKYKALEITTTISNGNSGGPSVDNHLEVEGLNTYGNSNDMRFAYMIPAEFVRDLSKDIAFKRDEATLTFLTGIQMLDQNYGGAALECFERVKELRKETPYIKNMINLSKEAPQEFPEGTKKEESEQTEQKKKEKTSDRETEQEDEPKSDSVVLIIVLCAVGFLVLVVITVIVLVLMKKRKKARLIEQEFNEYIEEWENEQPDDATVNDISQKQVVNPNQIVAPEKNITVETPVSEPVVEKKRGLTVRMGDYEPSAVTPPDGTPEINDDNTFFEQGKDL